MKQKMTTNEILDELKEIRILPITYTESEQDALDAVIHLLENPDDRILEETYEYKPPENLIADVVVSNSSGTTQWYVCSKCNGAVDIGDNYCKHCGRQFIKENGDKNEKSS